MNSLWPRPLFKLIQLEYFSVLLSLSSPPFIFCERPGQKVLGNTGKAFFPFLSDLYFYTQKKIRKTANLTYVKLNKMFKFFSGIFGNFREL